MQLPDEQPQIPLDTLIAELSLSSDPAREAIASELGALQSIYGDEVIKAWPLDSGSGGLGGGTVRYEVTLSLSVDDDEVSCTVLVSLPSTYPSSAPPQLQLLSRYIGPFGVDAALFGAILRTFISSEGVEWTEDSVCVFDGLEWVKEHCAAWYGDRKSEKLASQIAREDEKGMGSGTATPDVEEGKNKKVSELHERAEGASLSPSPAPTPSPSLQGIQIIEAEPVIDRKSAFVGRACRITDPAQVPLILAHLMSDRHIARAAHPIINAWRCQVGSVLHQDNDDDGETAAGGRLAHLLQILEVNNVLVIVTRYFGGILLGPDRFKHINQAARNALELGGFLDTPETQTTSGRKGNNARGRKR